MQSVKDQVLNGLPDWGGDCGDCIGGCRTSSDCGLGTNQRCNSKDSFQLLLMMLIPRALWAAFRTRLPLELGQGTQKEKSISPVEREMTSVKWKPLRQGWRRKGMSRGQKTRPRGLAVNARLLAKGSMPAANFKHWDMGQLLWASVLSGKVILVYKMIF